MTGPLKTGKYVAKTSGTFGLLWFTDFGEKFWEACTTVDDNAKLRLRTSGFDEMNWSISFRFGGYGGVQIEVHGSKVTREDSEAARQGMWRM